MRNEDLDDDDQNLADTMTTPLSCASYAGYMLSTMMLCTLQKTTVAMVLAS